MIRVCALGIRYFFFCVINQKPDLRPMDGPLEKWLGWGGGEGRGVGVGKSRKYSWKKSWLKKRSCKDQVKTKYPGKWITLLGLQTVPAWMGTWKSLTTVVLISWSWWIAHSPGFLYSEKRKKTDIGWCIFSMANLLPLVPNHTSKKTLMDDHGLKVIKKIPTPINNHLACFV